MQGCARWRAFQSSWVGRPAPSPPGKRSARQSNSRGCLSLNKVHQLGGVALMVVGVEPERDLKEDLLFSSRPHHAAASFRLPGPPELRVGRERSDTLAISTTVVLEGSLVHSVCIRVVAAHTKPIGGSPLPEKRKSKRKKDKE